MAGNQIFPLNVNYVREVLAPNLAMDSKSDKYRRAKKVLEYAKMGFLGDLHTLQDMGALAQRLYDHAQETNRQKKSSMPNIVSNHLGYIRSFISTDIPGEYKDDQVRKGIYDRIRAYQDAFSQGKNHRKDGKLSTNEKKKLEQAEIDVDAFSQFFRKVTELLQWASTKVEEPNVSPQELQRIQMVIVLGNLALESNVRLYPYALLKHDGRNLHDNTITFESFDRGKITLIFNIVKSTGVPIVRNVGDERLAMLMRKYYIRFRKNRYDHGYFFQTVNSRPIEPDYLSKQLNEMLKDTFGISLTTRLVRVIETIVSMDENRKFSYRELEAMNYARNHSIDQGLLYDRTDRMEE